MARLSRTQLVAKIVIAVGIVLSTLFAGAAPIDFTHKGADLTVKP
jgi:hypothetical protein